MMDITIFTAEEENLICIFDISSRTAAINSLNAAMPDFEEPELREIAENTLKKLNAMTDVGFSALSFDPTYDDEDYDETEV